MSYFLMILVGAVLVNNFVLSRFLGCCPFLGVSKKTETALGMSGAVIFVMTVAAAVTWCIDHWLLQPNGLGYIHTLAFILVIAALAQFVVMSGRKMPSAACKGGRKRFIAMSMNCTSAAITRMNASVWM